jgi:hypothetical protein
MSILFVASEISEYSEETSGDGAVETSYSADVSQASDIEQPCPDKTLQDDQQDSDNEDHRDSKYHDLFFICACLVIFFYFLRPDWLQEFT